MINSYCCISCHKVLFHKKMVVEHRDVKKTWFDREKKEEEKKPDTRPPCDSMFV